MNHKDYVILGLIVLVLFQFGVFQSQNGMIGNYNAEIRNLEDDIYLRIRENEKLEAERIQIHSGVEALLQSRENIIKSYDSIICEISTQGAYALNLSTAVDNDSLIEFFSRYRIDDHIAQDTMGRD